MLASPVTARAQQPGRGQRVAVLHLTAAPPAFEAFRTALLERGWRDGQTVTIDYRDAAGQGERFDGLAVDIVRSQPDVIVTGVSRAAVAARRATSTIPIVMAVSVDPVALGVVASLARPGGNVTGQAIFAPELSAKRLEILKEAIPSVARVALFWNASALGDRAATERHIEASHRASQALGLVLQRIEVQAADRLESAFQEARAARAGAIATIQSALFYSLHDQLAALSLKHRIPVISSETGFAEAGGLMNCGDRITDAWVRAAAQVDRILRGAKPGELPVEQPTKVELVVNLKAARALGITMPPALLLRADRVIQ